MISKNGFKSSNMNELSIYGVEELNQQELVENEGGIHWVIGSIMAQFVFELVDGTFWDDFQRGYSEVRN